MSLNIRTIKALIKADNIVSKKQYIKFLTKNKYTPNIDLDRLPLGKLKYLSNLTLTTKKSLVVRAKDNNLNINLRKNKEYFIDKLFNSNDYSSFLIQEDIKNINTIEKLMNIKRENLKKEIETSYIQSKELFRKNRVIMEDKGIVKQITNNEEDIINLESNIDYFIDNMNQIYKDVIFKSLRVKVRIVTDKISFNSFNFSFDDRKENIIEHINRHYASTTFKFNIVELDALFINDSEINFKDYVSQIKAFNPSQNQKYHKMTQCSTTKDRECIYQTYYFLYKDNTIKIAFNTKKIKEELNKEPKEVIEYVKKGELVNFLIYKSKEHNEKMFVEFFNSYDDFSVSPDGTIIKESPSLKDKVFLYDAQHVAPRSYTYINDEIRYPKSVYTLSPKNVRTINNNFTVIGYDFETYNDSNFKAIPYALCLSNDKLFYGNNIINDFCNYLDTIKIETDISKTKKKKPVHQYYFYGFNSSRFDNIFLFDELLKRNPKLKYIVAESSIKYIRYFNIRFYDMSLFYVGKLKSVAESFKLSISKGVFPYSFVNENNIEYIGDVPEKKYWNKENDYDEYIKENGNTFNMKEYTLKYCLLDSKLVKEIAIKHLENCSGTLNGKMFNVGSSPTGAGLALKMFNQVFQDVKLQGSPDKIQSKERLAYKGGRTEVFKKYFKSKNGDTLKYYDINSSYPYAMTYDMPYRYIKTINIKPTKVNNFVNHYLYMAKSKYIGNDNNFIPNLLERSKENDIIATKETEYNYFWGIELNEAIKNQCEIYVNEVNEYESKPIFKNYSEFLYNERLKVKKTNPAKANYYKLLLNSLYGKTGQNLMTNNKLCDNATQIKIIANNIDNKIKGFELIGDRVLIKYTNRHDKYDSVGNLIRFASYITAIARTNLSIMMRDVGHEHIFYCDTDSVFTDKDPSNFLIDQNKLGKWKIETTEKGKQVEISEAIFLAPKSYYYKVEDEICMKAKGQCKDNLREEYFYKIKDSGEGVDIENTMFFRKLDSIHIKPQIRQLMSVYNKRIWDENLSSPYNNLNDWHINKYGK